MRLGKNESEIILYPLVSLCDSERLPKICMQTLKEVCVIFRC